MNLCKNGHDIDLFGLATNGQCRQCERDRAKEYREKNRGKCKEASKKWLNGGSPKAKAYKEKSLARLKDYEERNKEKARERSRRYYEKNKEKVLERTAKYQKENKERTAKYQRTYLVKNRDKVNEKKHRRRARIYGRKRDKIDTFLVYERDRFYCGICGEKVDITLSGKAPLSPTLDHILPLAKGGTHTYDNVQLAHYRCNNIKGQRPKTEWRETIWALSRVLANIRILKITNSWRVESTLRGV